MKQEALAEAGMKCPACKSESKRFGKHRNGLQRFRCLAYRKTFTEEHARQFRIEDYLNDPRGVMAVQLLVEGRSVRTAERITGLHRDAILRLLVAAGKRCEAVMNRMIRNVRCTDIQAEFKRTKFGLTSRRRKATSGKRLVNRSS
jgi:transposase-like protein